MIFERYDHVKLVKIDDDLMRKGLSEGCVGDVVKVDNNVSVAFYNLSNLYFLLNCIYALKSSHP